MTDKQKHALAIAAEEIMALTPEAFRAELEQAGNGDIAKMLRHAGAFPGCPNCEKLEAECAAYREALEHSRDHCDEPDESKCYDAVIVALYSNTAGAELLEELRLLRSIAQEAKAYLTIDGCEPDDLEEALDAYRKRKP